MRAYFINKLNFESEWNEPLKQFVNKVFKFVDENQHRPSLQNFYIKDAGYFTDDGAKVNFSELAIKQLNERTLVGYNWEFDCELKRKAI